MNMESGHSVSETESGEDEDFIYTSDSAAISVGGIHNQCVSPELTDLLKEHATVTDDQHGMIHTTPDIFNIKCYSIDDNGGSHDFYDNSNSDIVNTSSEHISPDQIQHSDTNHLLQSDISTRSIKTDSLDQHSELILNLVAENRCRVNGIDNDDFNDVCTEGCERDIHRSDFCEHDAEEQSLNCDCLAQENLTVFPLPACAKSLDCNDRSFDQEKNNCNILHAVTFKKNVNSITHPSTDRVEQIIAIAAEHERLNKSELEIASHSAAVVTSENPSTPVVAHVMNTDVAADGDKMYSSYQHWQISDDLEVGMLGDDMKDVTDETGFINKPTDEVGVFNLYPNRTGSIRHLTDTSHVLNTSALACNDGTASCNSLSISVDYADIDANMETTSCTDVVFTDNVIGSIADPAVSTGESDSITSSSPRLADDLRQRRHSGISLEQFLVPPVLVNRTVATPKEDLGFAKVPGYFSMDSGYSAATHLHNQSGFIKFTDLDVAEGDGEIHNDLNSHQSSDSSVLKSYTDSRAQNGRHDAMEGRTDQPMIISESKFAFKSPFQSGCNDSSSTFSSTGSNLHGFMQSPPIKSSRPSLLLGLSTPQFDAPTTIATNIVPTTTNILQSECIVHEAESKSMMQISHPAQSNACGASLSFVDAMPRRKRRTMSWEVEQTKNTSDNAPVNSDIQTSCSVWNEQQQAVLSTSPIREAIFKSNKLNILASSKDEATLPTVVSEVLDNSCNRLDAESIYPPEAPISLPNESLVAQNLPSLSFSTLQRPSTLPLLRAPCQLQAADVSRSRPPSCQRPGTLTLSLPGRPSSWSPAAPLPESQSAAAELPKRPNSLNLTISLPPSASAPIESPLLELPINSESIPAEDNVVAMLEKSSSVSEHKPGSRINVTPSKGFLEQRGAREENSATRLLPPPNMVTRNTLSPLAAARSPVTPNIEPLTPPISCNIDLFITELGSVAPAWVPDSGAPKCMQCETRFTFTRRRHHCRACGKVFCSGCCNVKARLRYMEPKEARVCSRCYQDLLRAKFYQHCLTPMSRDRMRSSDTLTSVSSPRNDALQKENATTRTTDHMKQVKFSDSFQPEISVSPPEPSLGLPDASSAIQLAQCGASALPHADDSSTTAVVEQEMDTSDSPLHNSTTSMDTTSTPRHINSRSSSPLFLSQAIACPTGSSKSPASPKLSLNLSFIQASKPAQFKLDRNLTVSVSRVDLDCCMVRQCWCFVTRGLCAVGQDEVVIVLECLDNEVILPRDIFTHLLSLYAVAAKGKQVTDLGHTLVDSDSFLGSSVHAGFLYVRATFQCLGGLPLPKSPHLFAILVHRLEVPWLKVFPIRLMLRLGAQYRYYPCPLVSVRHREPVYSEIGHTILNMLVDFNNYRYRLPRVDGLVVHVQDRKTTVNLPKQEYNTICKILDDNNDHMMLTLEANFSMNADSHLVCMLEDDGRYETQAINIQNKPRLLTGASFIIFNGALQPNKNGVSHTKLTIVEDGLMVLMEGTSVMALKQSLRNMEDFVIVCGNSGNASPGGDAEMGDDDHPTEELVYLHWVNDKTTVNCGVESPIDGLSFEGVTSRRVKSVPDCISGRAVLRWMDTFYNNCTVPTIDVTKRLEELLAQACCTALTPHLESLLTALIDSCETPPPIRIGLRVIVNCDKVTYEIGADGRHLPVFCMSDLDGHVIPVLESSSVRHNVKPTVFELIFYLLDRQLQ